jgi:hypothetical protein
MNPIIEIDLPDIITSAGLDWKTTIDKEITKRIKRIFKNFSVKEINGWIVIDRIETTTFDIMISKLIELEKMFSNWGMLDCYKISFYESEIDGENIVNIEGEIRR